MPLVVLFRVVVVVFLVVGGLLVDSVAVVAVVVAIEALVALVAVDAEQSWMFGWKETRADQRHNLDLCVLAGLEEEELPTPELGFETASLKEVPDGRAKLPLPKLNFPKSFEPDEWVEGREKLGFFNFTDALNGSNCSEGRRKEDDDVVGGMNRLLINDIPLPLVSKAKELPVAVPEPVLEPSLPGRGKFKKLLMLELESVENLPPEIELEFGLPSDVKKEMESCLDNLGCNGSEVENGPEPNAEGPEGAEVEAPPEAPAALDDDVAVFVVVGTDAVAEVGWFVGFEDEDGKESFVF
ncbi:hypothetical protein WICPIJ_008042 [Wickerhamomyces pijperi]|uniref:Uncharacterized protein n=1 Tax=Wickerhamomyces pijperi TaxID=599730 RepID=A0A9P8PYL8_WICPI|nr:hypothetical protein WICPIJ_008042 [Wickerhamomyces pijperi]